MAPPYGPVAGFDLANRIVLITGGGSGIGLAFATLCLKASARVVIGDINLTPAARTLFESAGPSQAITRPCDVTKWTDLYDLISASVEAFGSVPDIYAPVAGVFEPAWSNFWDDDGPDDDKGSYASMRINVDHPIRLTRLAMKALAGAEKQGVVVLVASTAAIRTGYLYCVYTASKWAVRGFARSMAQADRDEGVRVVCICPGLVDSPLWRDREQGDKMMEWAKFGERKALVPEDIAGVMVKMVEDKEEGGKFSGGTTVLKTVDEERVLDPGWRESEGDEYDPSPRPEPELIRVRGALDKERGVQWARRGEKGAK